MADLYFWIYKELYPFDADVDIFQTFLRVLHEHFTVSKKKIRTNPARAGNGTVIRYSGRMIRMPPTGKRTAK